MDEHKIDRQDAETIDLSRILGEFAKAVRRLFWLPLALAAVCCLALVLRGWWSYTPYYASEVTFTVQTSGGSESDVGTVTSYYDKTTAEQLATTFPYIIQSDLFRDLLRQELGVGALSSSLTAETVENTNLFSLQATSRDPQDAYDTLQAVIRVYPRVADYVIGTSGLDLLIEPTVATEPYNGLSLGRTAVKGAAVGVLAGLVLLLGYALTRRSLTTPEEVKEQLNQTCLGALPQVRFQRRRQAFDHRVSIGNDKVSTAFQESVRSLRLRFLRLAQEEHVQVVMVTSTIPGEGKTTVAANLALSLSRNGARVILVDLDLRSPSVKQALGLEGPSIGPAELLARRDGRTADALVPMPGEERLRILAGDAASDAPKQQLASRQLGQLLGELRGMADYVVIDTPPCGILADSGTAARLADGIVYVLRSGVVQTSHVLDGLQFLAGTGTRVLGCVLNGTTAGSHGYGYGYGYGYGDGYGYGYGRPRKKRPPQDEKS